MSDVAIVRKADVLDHVRGLKIVHDPLNDPPTWAYITNEDDVKRIYFFALNDLVLGPEGATDGPHDVQG